MMLPRRRYRKGLLVGLANPKAAASVGRAILPKYDRHYFDVMRGS